MQVEIADGLAELLLAKRITLAASSPASACV
jgi:hypothetical protein